MRRGSKWIQPLRSFDVRDLVRQVMEAVYDLVRTVTELWAIRNFLKVGIGG